MKKIFFLNLYLLFFVSNPVRAQFFSGTGGAVLNNGGQETVFSLNVSGLSPATLDSTFGLIEVSFDITHPNVNELSVNLISPWGLKVQLTGVLSCQGTDFTGTCLNNNAPQSITTAGAPFTGTLRPVGNLGRFNASKPGNGSWKLVVKDFVAGANAGTLNAWGLRFGASPPKPVVLQSSNLPLVFINTNGQSIGEQDIVVDLGVVDNGAARNNISDPRNHYNGKAAIHIRGSSSKMFEKPSLKIELKDGSGAVDVEVPMFGMPAESDWVLTAGYNDKTLLRNALSQHLYRKMGRYSPRTRFVEVIINGEYYGVYTFMEQPKRGKERVSVAKMTYLDNDFPYVTGGYIVQINRSDDPGWYSLYPGVSNSGAKFYYQYNYPKDDEISDKQKSYIKAVLDTFETVMASAEYKDAQKGYRRYANDDTFIDFLIINEISKNADAYKLSTYLFKDNALNGGKLCVGPVWDYDIAWHNCNFGDADNELYWQHNIPNKDYAIPTWWKRLMEDEHFQNKLYCRYHTLRQYVLSNNEIYEYIDENAQLLAEARQRNFRQFPIIGAYIYPNPQDQQSASYQNEVADLKSWVQKRGAWLDKNVPGYCADVSAGEIATSGEEINVFPNPFTGSFKVICTASGDAGLRLIDMTGRVVHEVPQLRSITGEHSIDIDGSSLAPGVYFVQVVSDSGTRQARIMKER